MPARFHTVVAATDFSPLGNRAVALGCGALRENGTLRLVFVAPEQPSPAEQKALLERLGTLVPPGEGVRTETEVRDPRCARQAPMRLPAFSRLRERVGANLICVGAGGRDPLCSARCWGRWPVV